ncbi:MAG TPA: hypothetical protein P5079_11055, partial [Elusimicrobiota bacterium]|nr:hypothetical protein [Elusimicrobiota bacterium]
MNAETPKHIQLLGRKLFLRPLPYTPHLRRYLPSGRFLKRTASLTMSVVVFYSQVLCAGTSFLPTVSMGLPFGRTTETLMKRLEKWTDQGRDVLGYVFHGSVYEDRNKLLEPGSTPETLRRQEDRQKANMDMQQMNMQNRGLQLPSLLKQPGQETSQDTLKKIKLLDEGPLPGEEVSDAIQKEIEMLDQKMKKLASEGADFKYQVKLNDTGTLQKMYFKDGQLHRIVNYEYYDTHGHIIRENHETTYDSSDLLKSRNIERFDAHGERSVTYQEYKYQRGARFYDSKTQLISEIDEKITTPTGSVSRRVQKDMVYDGKRNLVSFNEKKTDEKGVESERWFWDAKYDDDKNILSYKQLSRENGADTLVNWSEGTYVKNPQWKERKPGEGDKYGHQQFLLAGYKQEIRSGDGSFQTQVWSNMAYNQYDNMVSYDRRTTDFQKLEIVTQFRDGVYDEFDRMTSYNQDTWDSFRHHQRLEFTGATYNNFDDVLSYVERVTEEGKTRERAFSGGIYDAAHNLMASYEKITDSAGQALVKDWSASGYEKGQLTGYHEVLTYDDMRADTTVTEIGYDSLGRPSERYEVKHVWGTGSDGRAVDVKILTDIQRDSEELQEEEVVLDAGLGIVMKMRNVYGYGETKELQAWDAAGRLVRDLTEFTTRSNMTAKGDYYEKKRTVGQDALGGTVLDSTAETDRTAGLYDGFGRLMDYSEVTIQNGLAGTRSKRTVDGMIYNVDGNLVVSREVSQNSDGAVTVSNRSEVEYDSLGRMTRYEVDTFSEAEGIRQVTHVERENIAYNGLDDISGYNERILEEGSDVLREVSWQGEYNRFAQLDHSRQTTHRYGTNLDGETLDVTDVTSTYGMKYSLNGLLAGYTEEMVSDATPALMTINVLDGISYDDAGRMIGFTQTTHQVSRSAVTPGGSSRNFFIDESAAALHSVAVTRRLGATYNPLGLVTGYVDVVGENGLTTTNLVSDIEYNSRGQMTGSTTISHKTGQEPQTFYYRADDPDQAPLSAWELTALLNQYPGKSMEELLSLRDENGNPSVLVA